MQLNKRHSPKKRENSEEKKSYASGAGNQGIWQTPASSNPGRVSRIESSYGQQKNLVPQPAEKVMTLQESSKLINNSKNCTKNV
jgi:hypothetical protein